MHEDKLIPNRSYLLKLGTRTVGAAPGKEPIEMDLEMQKLDPNRVAVLVAFRPSPDQLPADPPAWNSRCEGYYSILRKYLMAADG